MLWGLPEAIGQTVHSAGDDDFIEFWRSNGWVYQEGVKEGRDVIDLSEVPLLRGGEPYTASDFDVNTFDPVNLALVLNQEKTTVVRVGDLGTLLFYSLNRVQTLYRRHQINEAATQKSQKP